MRHRNRKGYKTAIHQFTLTELLVVIAIIGILASMLMPTLRKAVESARSLGCLNLQKQIGLGLSQYADSYKEYYPVVINGSRSWASTLVTTGFINAGENIWVQKTYYNLRCPVISELAASTAGTYLFEVYGLNCYVAGVTGFVSAKPLSRNNANQNITATTSWRTRSPSSTIILGDSFTYGQSVDKQAAYLNFWGQGQMRLRHQNRANVLMMDNSARGVSIANLHTYNWKSYVDEFGQLQNL